MKGYKINKTDTLIDSSISFVRPWVTVRLESKLNSGNASYNLVRNSCLPVFQMRIQPLKNIFTY
jgi:hypothetical protein